MQRFDPSGEFPVSISPFKRHYYCVLTHVLQFAEVSSFAMTLSVPHIPERRIHVATVRVQGIPSQFDKRVSVSILSGLFFWYSLEHRLSQTIVSHMMLNIREFCDDGRSELPYSQAQLSADLEFNGICSPSVRTKSTTHEGHPRSPNRI